MTERLPLFPLGNVLFPGLVLPLHIFEDRYRTLVADLMALPADLPRRFGVVALREGSEVGEDGVRALHEVGCTAEIAAVEAYEDGRYDLVTTGAMRFRVRTVDTDVTPYLMGSVDYLGEPAGDGVEPWATRTLALFRRYREILGADDEDLPDDPQVVSYLVAAAAVLDVGDKQALLAATDTTSRLRAEVSMLRREVALLRRLPSLPATDLTRTPYGLN